MHEVSDVLFDDDSLEPGEPAVLPDDGNGGIPAVPAPAAAAPPVIAPPVVPAPGPAPGGVLKAQGGVAPVKPAPQPLQREVAALQQQPVKGADFPAHMSRSGTTRAGAAFQCALAAMSGIADDAAEFGLADIEDPMSVEEALQGPSATQWRAALDKEHANLVQHGVYEWAKLPEGENLMDSKTVLRVKRGTQGEVTGYKARVCARGFTQIPGVHFDPAQVRAGVVRFETLRVMLAIAAANGSALRQFDVSSAYLHRPLREVIYMRPPPSLEHPKDPEAVWRLLKALYGTIQGGDYWAEERDEFMAGLGWTQLTTDRAAYRKHWESGEEAMVGFWVDDGTSAGDNAKLLELENAVSAKYGISGAGPLTWTLGIGFVRDLEQNTVVLSQQRYIEALARRFGLEDAYPVATPFVPGTVLTTAMAPQDAAEREDMERVPYRELVGALLYVMVATRTDIAFALSVLCKFMSDPGRAHWEAAKRVLRYLKGTAADGLTLDAARVVAGYSDADYAGDRDDRKSTGAYVFRIGVGAVSWAAKKQSVTALSTTEAEYMALTQAVKEAVWLQGLIAELGGDAVQIPLLGDNQGSNALARNPVFHNRTKHIDVQYHFVREKVADGTVTLDFVPTKLMAADLLTNALPRDRHVALCNLIGVRIPAPERGGVME